MENNDLITNRFSPGNSNPVFFAGRKQEIMEILLHLHNFRYYYSGSCPQHILILKGEDGVGKTAFLQRLKKQVLDEVNYYVPVFSSISQFLQGPNIFYKNFFSEIEKAISNSAWRREALGKFFKNKGWPRVAVKISPALATVASELAAMEGKVSALRPFFKIVSHAYQSPGDLKEILLFTNWLLEASEMFLLWMVDDFEQLKSAPELLEIIVQGLAEVEKYQRRQCVVLAIESREMEEMVNSFQSSQNSGIAPLLQNNTLIGVDSERQLALAIENLIGYLSAREKLVLVNISAELDRKKATTSLKNRCAAQFVTAGIRYAGDSHIDCLAQWGEELIAEVDKLMQNSDAAKQLVFVQADAIDSCRSLQQELAQQREFSTALVLFTRLLAQLDKQLQKAPEASLVVFIENFEKWIGPEGESTRRMIGAKSRRGDTLLYQSRFIAPTTAFVEFFNAINRSIHSLASIALVAVTSIQEFETAFTLENKADKIFTKSPTFELIPLSKYDAIHMLKEIAARSGVMLTSDIAVDIYNHLGGMPLHLQYCGYNLLADMVQTIPSDEIGTLKECLLKMYNAQSHGSNSRLQEGPDGRARLMMPIDYYHNNAPSTVDDFYRLLLKKIRPRLGRDILEKLCEGPMSPAALLIVLEGKHQGITEANIIDQIEEIKAIKLIDNSQGQVGFVNPWLKEFVKNLFEQKKATGTLPDKKITRAITRQRLQTSPVNLRTRRLTPSVAFAQIQQTAGKDLLIEATTWIGKRQLPSCKLLDMLSQQISLVEGNDKFRDTMRYIYSLCSCIIDKLELDTDIGQAISLLKEHLVSSQKQQGQPNLYSALNDTFLSEKALEQIEQQQDYYLSAKFHLLKYAITSDSGNWDQAVAAFWQAFTGQSTSEGMYRLSLEIEERMPRIADDKGHKQLNICQTILESARQLLSLEERDSHRYLQQELVRLIPSHLPKEFHEYFVGYLQKLIDKEPALRQGALETLGLYGHIVNENSQLLLQLTEHAQQSGPTGRAALTALMRLFPYLNKQQKRQVIIVLEEAVMHHPDLTRRQQILRELSECPLLYEADELAAFFYGAIKNEGNVSVKAHSWMALARVKKLCSEEFQQEMSSFLIEYYDDLLPELPYASLLSYTQVLLLTYDEPMQLTDSLGKLLDVLLAQSDVIYCCQASPLPPIYPLLSQEQKQRFRDRLREWLSSSNSKEKSLVLAHLPFCTDAAEQADLITAMPAEYLPALRRLGGELSEFTGALSEEARDVLWYKCLDLVALPNSGYEAVEQLREIYRSALEIAMAMACHFPPQRTARLANLIAAATDQGLPLSGDNSLLPLLHCLPYFDADHQQQILEKCRQRLVPGEVSLEELANILAILAWPQDPVTITDEEILVWLRSEMNAHPEQLLASATAFFGRTWKKLPEGLQHNICQDTLPYLCFSEYASPVTIFLVKAMGDAPEFMRWAYIYQFAPGTCHLAFSLYEIFPELLADTLWLEDNYHRVRQQDPYWLGLKMADFHQSVGSYVRAQELLNWVLENNSSLIIKRAALRQRRYWELQQSHGDQAQQTLAEIVQIGWGF